MSQIAELGNWPLIFGFISALAVAVWLLMCGYREDVKIAIAVFCFCVVPASIEILKAALGG